MAADINVAFRYQDQKLLESPDGMMRDSVLVTDVTAGTRSVSAGLVWVHPHGEIHEDTHAFDEVYYVIRGHANVIMDGRAAPIAAGEIVLIPAGVRHRIDNPNDEVFQIFWLISTNWADLKSVQEELDRWPVVSPASGWHLDGATAPPEG